MKQPLEAPKLVDNLGDEEQVRKGRTKADILEQRRLDRWAQTLGAEDGRLLVWEILEMCGAFQSALGATDSLTNYNAGRQDVGHEILDRIHRARPNALVEMMLENAKEKSL